MSSNCLNQSRLWILLAAALVFPSAGFATDVDGPDGQQDFDDRGDAPQGIAAYPDGTIGRFPGVHHINNYDAWNLWLGGYPIGAPLGEIMGVDSDGYTLRTPPDCYETAFGMTFGQDECVQDSTDMCLRSPVVLNPCETTTFRIAVTRVSTEGGILNVLVDLNGDGDWGDAVFCESEQDSISEWVVKNYPIPLDLQYLRGYAEHDVPSFLVGPRVGPTWMRITLSSEAILAPDDFPTAGGELLGGETEDYPLVIGGTTPVRQTSWGGLKARYH